MGKSINRNWIFNSTFIALIALSFSLNATTGFKIEASESNGIVKIKTLLYDLGSETSVGYFYRLTDIDNGNSFFWNDVVIKNSSNGPDYVEKDFTLPVGKYRIVAYQSRKNGPVKTATILPSNNVSTSFLNVISNPTTPYTFPQSNLSSTFDLISSWNISTTNFLDDNNPYNNPSHYIAGLDVNRTPDEDTPWVFMTLAKNHGEPTTIATELHYPSSLTFIGAILGDCMISATGGTCLSVSITNDESSQTLRFSNNINPNIPIHLMFMNTPNYIRYPNQVEFNLKYKTVTQDPGSDPVISDSIAIDFNFDVQALPHDPNALIVDKKELCACQKDEFLTYQIKYQNNGHCTCTNVKVTLADVGNLESAFVSNDPTTHLWSADITKSTANNFEFNIDYSLLGGLPGVSQNMLSCPKVSPEQCEDFFYVRIKKKDCTPAGTRIHPRAIIQFDNLGTIETNLDETIVVDGTCCNPCPKNINCLNCKQRKKCCLFHRKAKHRHSKD